MRFIKFLKKLYRIFITSIQDYYADGPRAFILVFEDLVDAFVPAAAWIFLSLGGTVANVNTDKLVVYYLVLFILQVVITGHISWHIQYSIKSGRFSANLLKPIHPLVNNVLAIQADKALSILNTIPIFVAVVVFTGHTATLINNFPNILYFLIALVLALILWIEIQLILGLCAFWFTKIDGISKVFYVINGLWGAKIAPMAMLPEIVQKTAYYLPFKFLFSFPADTFLNQFNYDDFVKSLFIGTVWVIVLCFVIMNMYKFGLKKYEAIGI